MFGRTGQLLAASVGLSLLIAASPDPLAQERWRHRVVLVFADRADDPAVIRQSQSLASGADGLRTRDVRVVTIIGQQAPPDLDAGALRAAFAQRTGFAVVLVGKDGGEKSRHREPVGVASLLQTIDAMPMARDEAAQRARQ